MASPHETSKRTFGYDARVHRPLEMHLAPHYARKRSTNRLKHTHGDVCAIEGNELCNAMQHQRTYAEIHCLDIVETIDDVEIRFACDHMIKTSGPYRYTKSWSCETGLT